MLTAAMVCLSMHLITQATADSIPTDGLSVTIAGRAMRCGETPVYMDNEMPTEGMSVPGEGLYLNPFLLNRQPAPVRMFIFKHECAHEVTGPDEFGADSQVAGAAAPSGRSARASSWSAVESAATRERGFDADDAWPGTSDDRE